MDDRDDRRRDEVLRHMRKRSPQPHKPLSPSKRKARAASKGRMRKGKSQT